MNLADPTFITLPLGFLEAPSPEACISLATIELALATLVLVVLFGIKQQWPEFSFHNTRILKVPIYLHAVHAVTAAFVALGLTLGASNCGGTLANGLYTIGLVLFFTAMAASLHLILTAWQLMTERAILVIAERADA